MTTLMFLGFRVFHVLFAAIWIGSTVLTTALLVPAANDAGPSGGQVLSRMDRRGFHIYMAVFAGMTVVTGVYLLWRFTGGFDPSVVATHAGIAFGIGGAAGVLAAVIGAVVVGRSGKQVMELMGRVVGMPDGSPKVSLLERVAVLRRRMNAGARLVIALQTTALLLMTIAHYI